MAALTAPDAAAPHPLTLSALCGTMPHMAATASPPPADYGQLLGDLQRQVRTSQAAAMRAANAEMLALYRTIGQTILDRQPATGRDDELIDRIGADLRAAFPDMAARSLSPGNLRYMRALVEAWPDPTMTPPLDQLTWGHIRLLLEEVADPQVRDWYAAASVRFG